MFKNKQNIVPKNKKNNLNREDEYTKAQFAAYLNMACNNFAVLLTYIAKKNFKHQEIEKKKQNKTNSNGGNSSKKIDRSNEIDAEQNACRELIVDSLKSKEVFRKSKLIDDLDKNLPFLAEMVKDFPEPKKSNEAHDDNQEEKPIEDKYCEVIKYIYSVLSNNRHQSTHGKAFEPGKAKMYVAGSNLINPLRKTFDAARRVVKDRFSYSEENMKFLTDRMVKRDNKYVERSDFFYSFGGKTYKNEKGENSQMLSDTAVVFFTCLFLEKKYIYLFLSNTLFKGKNVENENERKIIFEIFSCYRMHQKFEKLDSEKSEMALSLDMLNELRKCPKVLFEHLPVDKQNKFRVSNNEGPQDDIKQKEFRVSNNEG
ncbi:MAG: hypothetical protein HUK15_03405, partial [Bacteroidales bacterium]|nr:hypothetical protein [Bacteroidales bacterium]